MQFKRLDVKNLLSFKSASLDLSGSGLTLVLGQNLDSRSSSSNGSGKSNILEAIVWCLYGNVFKPLEGDQVICNKVGKDCFGSINFEEDGHSGRFERFRKLKNQTGLRLFIDGKDVTRSSVNETQKLIDSILGVDFKTFANIISFPQGSARFFASLTDREQKDVLERILGLEELTAYLKAAKEKSSIVSDAILIIEENIRECERVMDTSEYQLATLYQRHKSFNDEKKKKVQQIVSRITTATVTFQTFQEQHAEISSEKEEAELRRVSSELQKVDKAKLQDEEHKQISERETFMSRMAVAVADLTEISESLTVLTSISEVSHCPYCGQNLTKESRKTHQEKLLVKQKKAKQVAKLNKAKSDICTTAIKSIRGELSKVESLHDSIGLLKEEITDKELLRSEAVADIKVQRQLIEELREQKKQAEKETSPYQPLIEKEEVTKRSAENTLKGYYQHLEEQKTDMDYLKFWEIGFGNKGLKSYILDNVVNVLNEKANYYSQILTDGETSIDFHTQTQLKSGEQREKFGVDVALDNGASVYGGTSGGEKRRADLAILLALRHLVCSRTAKSFGLLIADEIFDWLDKPGIDRASEILVNEAKNGSKVFLITHLPELVDKDVFDSTITIRKKNGFSVIIDS